MNQFEILYSKILWCHNRADNSDKVYCLNVVHDQSDDSYKIFADYGRRGKNLKRILKESFASRASAFIGADIIADEKFRKGYRIQDNQNFYPGQMQSGFDLVKVVTLEQHYAFDDF